MGAQELHPDPARDSGGVPAAPDGIVVGVDGSDHGQCALPGRPGGAAAPCT
jgi:hypothetical protein